ncbi:acetyl-CoA carboxylase biotin carboxyl carrier protein [Lactobacillus sp. PV012]|uniref:acetyl-CoA carboxylase biotin carboxyl carrier protein n=1 Tax=Lactobacillus sp. PV012 TaxID=2594494 RepID=UPI002240840D|nr:biotin/lipoyl-containing protein [Lactobacillus sp. PV012]QNQ82029.1 acetyl-CoA carboxylase, biotin carboxyl carrier protein [Lactobacillus sp. PV012]
MNGNIDEIQILMKQFEDSEIRELKIDSKDFHLYLSKNKVKSVEATKPALPKVAVKKEEDSPQPKKQEKLEDAGVPVKAPIVGIVYLQAKPGQPAFVKVGQHLKKGDTICIIEAMKMMTEVKSTVTGTVKAIKVENEDLVEVDQPLIMVEED